MEEVALAAVEAVTVNHGCSKLKYRVIEAVWRTMNFLCELEVECPFCGEPIPVTVDTSQGDHSTIEDCTVCCRPIQFNFECEPGEVIRADVAAA